MQIMFVRSATEIPHYILIKQRNIDNSCLSLAETLKIVYSESTTCHVH